MLKVNSDNSIRLNARSAARFWALQALYQLETDPEKNTKTVVAEFAHFRTKEKMEGLDMPKFDSLLFAELIYGVEKLNEDLQSMVMAVLPSDWPIDRLDPVLRAMFLAGTYELSEKFSTPPRVIISEYMNLGHLFFEKKERGMINGVLHEIARALRPDELESN